MSDCIFCKIIDGEIPADKIYEDEHLIAFNDLSPQAPVHVLVIPKKHIASTEDLLEDDAPIMGHIMTKIKDIAKLVGITNGYRLVINCGEDGQQTVPHLHIHLLGKRSLQWPPG
ncbi:MAG: histidine triad nucleotide-binding protein [Eubacteriales bacterium]|nr:histidine triad nucleotide-binding protein [Eubacteriales bacterium]MDY3332803.1 histidine triad nucleotide-binding protein [Gallibacter sp.]